MTSKFLFRFRLFKLTQSQNHGIHFPLTTNSSDLICSELLHSHILYLLYLRLLLLQICEVCEGGRICLCRCLYWNWLLLFLWFNMTTLIWKTSKPCYQSWKKQCFQPMSAEITSDLMTFWFKYHTYVFIFYFLSSLQLCMLWHIVYEVIYQCCTGV